MNVLSNQLNDQELINRSNIIKKNMKSKQRTSFIISIFLTLFVISIFLITMALIILLLTGSPVQGYIQAYEIFLISVAVLAMIFYLLVIIPIIIVTFVSYKRTTYIGFLIEFFITAQLLILPALTIILLLNGQVLYAMFTFFLIFIGKLEYKFVKKPLIWGINLFGYEKNVFSGGSDIVAKQSLYVDEFKDGYSNRPMFTNINEILNNSSNEQQIITDLEYFAKFLGSNGDIIGYSINERVMKLYLRTTLIQAVNFYLIKSQIKRAIQIIKKEDLTSITINFTEGEMNLYLNREDYEFLGELTYQKLSRRILDQFKISLGEFFDNNYDKALKAINPPIGSNVAK